MPSPPGGVVTVGDAVITGHLCQSTTTMAGPGAVGLSGVYVNGKPVCRVGDLTAPHLAGVPPVCVSHTAPITMGKDGVSGVYANGMPIATNGSQVDAGTVTASSTNVACFF